MPSRARISGAKAGLFETFRSDFHDARAALRRQGVGETAHHTAQDLSSFFLSDDQQRRLAAKGRFTRWFWLTAWLLKALVLNLSPGRRLLLLLSAVLAWLSFQGDTGSRGGSVLVAMAPVIVVLLLELKDKLLARWELEDGRAVQQALMPAASPSVPGWDVWMFTRPANDVGGDLVDHLRVSDERYAVVLADVAGKGLPAALLMAKLQATVRALAPDMPSLGALGAKLNAILCRDGLPDRFATLAYLELSPETGTVRLLDAGHPAPLLRAGGTVGELEVGSAALGFMPDTAFVEQRVTLRPSDTLVVYSDGITEAMNLEGEFFGLERLRSVVGGSSVGAALDLGSAIVRAVDAFVDGAPRHDDLSLLVVRRMLD